MISQSLKSKNRTIYAVAVLQLTKWRLYLLSWPIDSWPIDVVGQLTGLTTRLLIMELAKWQLTKWRFTNWQLTKRRSVIGAIRSIIFFESLVVGFSCRLWPKPNTRARIQMCFFLPFKPDRPSECETFNCNFWDEARLYKRKKYF